MARRPCRLTRARLASSSDRERPQPYLDARRDFERFTQSAGDRHPKAVADASQHHAERERLLELERRAKQAQGSAAPGS